MYGNINNSDLDGMSLASFCQSKAVLFIYIKYKIPQIWNQIQRILFLLFWLRLDSWISNAKSASWFFEVLFLMK